jgi:hypothetical protein
VCEDSGRHYNADTEDCEVSRSTRPLKLSPSDTAAPILSSFVPAASAKAVNAGANITATFNEAVDGVSTSTFTVRKALSGEIVTAAVSRNGTTDQWILNPAATLAPDTAYTVKLTGGASAIRDAAGNALFSTQWSFTTGPAPILSGFVPGASAKAINAAANITATFNETVQGVSTSSFTVHKASGGAIVAAAATRNGTTNQWILNPAATLAPDTVYTVNLTGGPSAIRDAAGNALSSTQWNFTTGPAPSVTAKAPAANAAAVGRNANVTATFSEAVQSVSRSTFTLKNAATGASITAAVSRNGTTNQWIVNPTATLAARTRYTATLAGGPAAIRDLAGNPLTATSWSFTTGA